MSSDEQMLLEALRANVILWRQAIMVGNPVPIVQRMWAAARNPRLGDLVIEESTIYGDADLSKIGTLLRIEREPMFSKDEWDEVAEERASPTEQVYYIRGLDGVERRWVNATFMRIAYDLDDEREMRGEPPLPGIYSREEIRRGRLTG